MQDTIKHAGLTFRVTTEYDEGHPSPWKDECGHGPVEERRTDYTGYVQKAPGEVVLKRDRWGGYVYDRAEALRIAARDGWGLSDEHMAKLAARLGRAPTKREILAESVERDIAYLRGWLNDDWHYCVVCVELLDVDGEGTGVREYLGGVETFSGDSIEFFAHDLAEQIADTVGDSATYTEARRARTTTYTIREAA